MDIPEISRIILEYLQDIKFIGVMWFCINKYWHKIVKKYIKIEGKKLFYHNKTLRSYIIEENPYKIGTYEYYLSVWLYKYVVRIELFIWDKNKETNVDVYKKYFHNKEIFIHLFQRGYNIFEILPNGTLYEKCYRCSDDPIEVCYYFNGFLVIY